MSKFLTSNIGPMIRKAITGDVPKLESNELPTKASASLHRESRNASNINKRMAIKGVELIEVKIRVGTYT